MKEINRANVRWLTEVLIFYVFLSMGLSWIGHVYVLSLIVTITGGVTITLAYLFYRRHFGPESFRVRRWLVRIRSGWRRLWGR